MTPLPSSKLDWLTRVKSALTTDPSTLHLSIYDINNYSNYAVSVEKFLVDFEYFYRVPGLNRLGLGVGMAVVTPEQYEQYPSLLELPWGLMTSSWGQGFVALNGVPLDPRWQTDPNAALLAMVNVALGAYAVASPAAHAPSPHGQLLAALLPPVAYDRRGNKLGFELEALGLALDAVQAGGRRMANAMSPSLCERSLLDDWERVYGLPLCVGASDETRVVRLLIKIKMSGDQSMAWYIQLAKLLGYTIQITNRAPFICGYARSHVGVTALAGEWVRYVWDVSGLPTPAPLSICGLGIDAGWFGVPFQLGLSQVGIDPMLRIYTSESVQSLFLGLKPAHTLIRFV